MCSAAKKRTLHRPEGIGPSRHELSIKTGGLPHGGPPAFDNNPSGRAAQNSRPDPFRLFSGAGLPDTPGFGLHFERREALDDVFVAVLRSIVDDGHLLFRQVDPHVLDPLAERRHVVHDLLHAVFAVDVGCEDRRDDLFLGGAVSKLKFY